MHEAALIYPHQLFAQHPALAQGRPVWMAEDPLFLDIEHLHPFKRVLHRASMAAYAQYLRDFGYPVLEAGLTKYPDTESLLRHLAAQGIRKLHLADPSDYLLERRLNRFAKRFGLEITMHPSPGFLLTRQTVLNDLGDQPNALMASFYIRQRKRHGLLLDPAGKPLGGAWSFDAQNRKKLPRGVEPPAIGVPAQNPWLEAAWAGEGLPNPASAASQFPYPVTHADALHTLRDFCQNRLHAFGDYQDALDATRPFLFHAVLTPALNIGLLTPEEVLQAVLQRHADEALPLPALEGFIRQLIGWREFMRGIYLRDGSEQRRQNFWGFTDTLPRAFLRGETGLPPLDDALRKVDKLAYAHHIERLMVLGNFLLLSETHPDAVYGWFMNRFIDAYDWVMVPNVYGMSQYADGGRMTTKPYLSGSNYLRKQSHYPAGDWCADWDALFWRFIWLHRDVFAANPRMRMMASLADNMATATRNAHLNRAERVLERLRA
jgi:deoxyribodipyrimidine photolyase-related protein